MDSSLAVSPIPAVPSRQPLQGDDEENGGHYYQMPAPGGPQETSPPEEENEGDFDDDDRTVSDLSNRAPSHAYNQPGFDTVTPPRRLLHGEEAEEEVDTKEHLHPGAAAYPLIVDLSSPSSPPPPSFQNTTSPFQQPQYLRHQEEGLEEEQHYVDQEVDIEARHLALLSPQRLYETEDAFYSRLATPKGQHYASQLVAGVSFDPETGEEVEVQYILENTAVGGATGSGGCCDHGFGTAEAEENQDHIVGEYSTLLAMIHRAKDEQRHIANAEKKRKQLEDEAGSRTVVKRNTAAFERGEKWREKKLATLALARTRKEQAELEALQQVRKDGILREHRKQRNNRHHVTATNPEQAPEFHSEDFNQRQKKWQESVARKKRLEKESQEWKNTIEDQLGVRPQDSWMCLALTSMSPADYELQDSVSIATYNSTTGSVGGTGGQRKFLTVEAAEQHLELLEQEEIRKANESRLDNIKMR